MTSGNKARRDAAPCSGHLGWVGGALLFVIVQCALIGYEFPVSELWTSLPLMWMDSAYHWYQIWIARELAPFGALVGYDPAMSAGQVVGLSTNASAKFPALYAFLFGPDVDVSVVYKVFSFTSACLAPVVIFFAACWAGSRLREAVLVGALALVLWWTSEFRVYHSWGQLSYGLAVFAAVATAASARRFWCAQPRLVPALAHGLFIGLATLYHPLFAVAFAMLAVAIALTHSRQLVATSAVLHAGCAAVAVAALNWIWIEPTLRSGAMASWSAFAFQKAVGLGVFSEHFGAFGNGGAFRWMLLLAGAAAPFVATSDSRKRVASYHLVAAAIAFVYSAFAAFSTSLATLQPNRFVVAGLLFLCVPAGIAITAVLASIVPARGRGRWSALALSAVVSCGVVAAFYVREVLREVSYGPHPHIARSAPAVRGPGPNTAWLTRWLSANADDDSRVLYEHSLRASDRTHVVGWLRANTGIEMVGGAYATSGPDSFVAAMLFGRAVEEYSDEALSALLRILNVGIVVAASERSRARFAAVSFMRTVARHGEWAVFRVKDPPGFFVKGAGRIVARQPNSLELETTTGAEAVLRYNFVPGLVSTPPVELVPLVVEGWSVPLIRIPNPPPRLVISYRAPR
ncbi:MAG: hypothetical protein KJZ83_16890 [Burkholderiaceae bacterium]|nr:hypothetical protein [Burkholderiaceae bacterium]